MPLILHIHVLQAAGDQHRVNLLEHVPHLRRQQLSGTESGWFDIGCTTVRSLYLMLLISCWSEIWSFVHGLILLEKYMGVVEKCK